MALSLLSTKFYIPSQRANAVARAQLVARLRAAVDRSQTFTLLSGPAGSGKTTLLSQLIAELDRPVAWLSLEEADNAPHRFWTYLLTGVQRVRAGIGESALALLAAGERLPGETIPTLLLNDLAASGAELIVVLDDYHLIQDPAIHDGLLFLLDHQPDNLHMVLSTRADPPWPLARYRARNRLCEIRARDLRFSLDECAAFLDGTMGLRLSAEEVAALAARTEGWIAGLQLAALALQSGERGGDTSAFVQAFSGSNLYIAEYLVEEVLRRHPGELQTFLLQTSILDKLNAGLCDAVTGRQDGAGVLTTLHRRNLFVVSLDGEGQWFRYHHLFADLLQARLRHTFPAQAIAALHRRAAAWYEENRLFPQAVHHALAANDFEHVAALVKHSARSLIFSGRVYLLSAWLEALPEASFQAHPHLVVYRFWVELLQRKAELSERDITEMESLLNALSSAPENDRLRGELLAVLCRALALSGRTSRTIRLAQEARAYLRAEDLASLARANSALAIAHDLEGRVEAARAAYEECDAQAHAAGDVLLAVQTAMARGLIQQRRGQLNAATATFTAITEGPTHAERVAAAGAGMYRQGGSRAGKPIFVAGPGYIGLAAVHLERYELEAAEAYLTQGMELCRRGGLDGLFIGRMLLSRLRQAQGEFEQALAEIQMPQEAFKDKVNVATRQIQLRLARGDVDGAWRWVAPLVESVRDDPEALRPSLVFIDNPEVAIARVYLARGERDKALRIVDGLAAMDDAGLCAGHLLEICLLRAVAYQGQDTETLAPETMRTMRAALALAVEEGHRLRFLEAGPQLVPVLRLAAGCRDMPARLRRYAQQLLDASGKAAAAPGAAAGLVESLTPREMEVLQLIAAGDSNRAIADKLAISVRTVKKHAGNIYGKLNVSRRTEAIARARELGLLPA